MIIFVYFFPNASDLPCAKNLRKWAEKVFASSTLVFHDHMYKDSHVEKFKRVMRHIKLISMNTRLFLMHLKVHEVD
jgi:hypothetical protein